MPFPVRGIKLPRPAPDVDSRIASLEIAIQRIYLSEAKQTYRFNLTTSERRGIAKLLQLKDRLRYTVGDKCGFFVVMPQMIDKEVTCKVLSDPTTYGADTMARFTEAHDRVKQAIIEAKVGRRCCKTPFGFTPGRLHTLQSREDAQTSLGN
ncbi:hypothetical protein ANCDUO_00783 [Ancylostoma duodenale]|uniref:Uncharacterized protein n=1 Tax=Ancylostoma duodenale TaxID=51022 RepID=A0A0C2HGW7_9BILA|nr:hypothetical protein ANCDUO_00783 [Ancylostoma duodenale]